MTNVIAAAAIAIATITAAATNILTWDTNTIGSPVTVYKAERIGIATGNAYVLPLLSTGTVLVAIGQGTVVPATNWLTLTNWISRTNTVILTNTISKTNTVTQTNRITVTVTNDLYVTNWVWGTNWTVVTITNNVWIPPGKR